LIDLTVVAVEHVEMLSLSDQQLQMIMAAAELLPRGNRDSFMRSIASRLSDVDHRSDNELASAVSFILSSHDVATGRAPLIRRYPQEGGPNAETTQT
jgi:hypothetical protein